MSSSQERFSNCKDLESKYGDDKCKCEYYREYFPDCQCECESVSSHSPGTVQHHEPLVRALFSRHHLDGENRPSLTYLRGSLGRRGFSVDRLTYSNDTEIISQKKHDAKFHGYLSFAGLNCDAVRALINTKGKRLYCVYDTALEQNIAHADICQNEYFKKGTPRRNKLNWDVADRLNRIFSKCAETPSRCFSEMKG